MSVPCLDNYLEKKLELRLLLLMVLMKGLGWVLQRVPLIVLMKENLRVPCFDLEFALLMLLIKANM